MKVAIIHGPNLNLLGKREPDVYGNQSFEEFLFELKSDFPDFDFSFYQSNIEGEIVNFIQSCDESSDYIILNAAAYTHTSVAIADAVAAIQTPVIGIHISNIYKREVERHIDLLAGYCKACLFGFGLQGYRMACLFIRKEIP
ncbi:MAG: type II 3-dehydroquinate dehydratase [Bacteroidetes bacterium]|nr:type II 3-dehydroquinate dehydratase [Bacteroidota bacterium]